MIGFSAGTTPVLGTVMTGNPVSEPAFAGIIYGGAPMDTEIPENAPPLFILRVADDAISTSNPNLFEQWSVAGKSVELHIYSRGGHGFGMKKQVLPIDSWIERFGDWLGIQDF